MDHIKTRIGNTIDGQYSENVSAVRPYEYVKGEELRNSRRDAINDYYGIGSGRNFSDYLQWQGWSIREIALLQFTRFNIDSDIIGRDILNQGLSEAFIRDIVYRVWKAESAVFFEYVDNDGNKQSITAWKTSTGKRTWKGNKDDGMGHERIKVHYQNKGKRKRGIKGW